MRSGLRVRLTTSPFVGKALQAWSKLRGKADDGAVVVIATRITAEGRGDREEAILRNFAVAMTPRSSVLSRPRG